MVTDQQKRAIDSIISIFETGRVPTPAAYATCAVLKDGAGISYGNFCCFNCPSSKFITRN